MNAPLLKATDLVAAGREPPIPCALQLADGSRLDLLRPLRVLPGKRITGEGLWQGQRVLAKLFIASGSARHWQREHDGLLALAAAGIPSPPLLCAGSLAEGGHYLMTAFLPVHSLQEENFSLPLLEAACQRIGQLHDKGLTHSDLHPGNFLVDAGTLLVIDGAAVCRHPALATCKAEDNLASFLAQLPLDVPTAPLLTAWLTTYPHPAPDGLLSRLLPLVEAHRQLRLDDYLRKSVRPCTLFDVHKSFRRFTAVAREDAHWLAPLLDDPDSAIASGVLLKRGNTATVARVNIAGRSLVIKRYNIKNVAHALSRACRPSRAWHSWIEGHRLCFFGLPTPRPRALIEERLGPLHGRAWLIADECTGPNLLEVFAPCVDSPTPPAAESAALLRLIESLRALHIHHGDFKATNLLWDAGKVVVIDLDSMTPHASTNAWRKDRMRLLANWPAESALHRWLDTNLPS